MDDCCTAPLGLTELPAVTCPSCQMRGVSAELPTVKALLTEFALRRIQLVSHRFCRTAACSIVYYDEAGAMYGRPAIRVRVWQKEPIGDRPVCYCFGETETTILQEFTRNGNSEAVQRVKAHIEANRCACEVRNPRGTCCLGDLAAAVMRVRNEFFLERGV